MEVDAERAAPTFEAFLGAWQWSRASCGSSCCTSRRDRGYGPGRRSVHHPARRRWHD
jgi:hypothetical protein